MSQFPVPIVAPRDGPVCRRFTILDGMILIGAAAVWLLAAGQTLRTHLALLEKLHQQGRMPFAEPNIVQSWLVDAFGTIVGGVGILTLTFLVIRLRKPRAPLNRLIWQPGMMACTIICWCMPLLFVFSGRLITPSLWILMSTCVALAWVASSWSGRLRPEAGWIDRLGTGLGACWIAFAVYPLFLLSNR